MAMTTGSMKMGRKDENGMQGWVRLEENEKGDNCRWQELTGRGRHLNGFDATYSRRGV